MGALFSEAAAILAAFSTNDSWEIRQALQANGAWLLGLAATLLGGFVIALIYRSVPLLERNFERSIMVVSYLLTAAIIFVEVVRRFVFNEQAPWSTTLPPFLFLIMTWVGCAYNTRLRTHLAFAEFRTNMGRNGQFACLCLDAVLWLGFAWIVVVTGARLTANSAANFQILLGTDNVLQWWFLISVPLAFILLAGRAIENLMDDVERYRNGEPLIRQAVIGGD